MYVPMDTVNVAKALALWMRRVSNGNVMLMENVGGIASLPRVEAYCKTCKATQDLTYTADAVIWPEVEKFCKDHSHWVAGEPAKKMASTSMSVFTEATGRKFREG